LNHQIFWGYFGRLFFSPAKIASLFGKVQLHYALQKAAHGSELKAGISFLARHPHPATKL
jgi:hypothetical protein